MKNTDYIVIQAHMVSDLELSGNRLVIYALIHGFCKDGKHEFTGSLKYLCEWTNLTKPTVASILKSLVDDGLIEKREYIVNNIKFCAYSIPGGGKEILPVVKKSEQGGKEILPGGGKEILPNNNNNNNNNIYIVESDELFVDRMYSLYPSKCPVRNAYLGKCLKDKTRIKALLKNYSKEDIERVISKEIESKYGKIRMYNFSTFLNNFPDPNELFDSGRSITQETNNPYPKGYWQ